MTKKMNEGSGVEVGGEAFGVVVNERAACRGCGTSCRVTLCVLGAALDNLVRCEERLRRARAAKDWADDTNLTECIEVLGEHVAAMREASE